MDNFHLEKTTKFHKKLGLQAQRRFPNEDLDGFLCSIFFHVPLGEKILKGSLTEGRNKK